MMACSNFWYSDSRFHRAYASANSPFIAVATSS
jgi:hypothetical protein